MEIDYGQNEATGGSTAAGSTSTLPQEIQQLVHMLFDVESMKKAMLEFEVIKERGRNWFGDVSSANIGSCSYMVNRVREASPYQRVHQKYDVHTDITNICMCLRTDAWH